MIRPAEDKDIPRILELLTQVDMVHHEGRPDIFKGPATKYNAEELSAMFKDHGRPVFVSTDENGRVEGYAICIFKQFIGDPVLTDIKTLYIDDICVDENLRGRHIGSGLYQHVLKFAREKGCYNVTLNVWSCNEKAMAFYERCGLKPQKVGMEAIL
ncbi:MAG: GNAT family N-acetyltransferase [Lachnospiraceae bacterium]|nr:GNAT family N-acetyltransferase [Lachnospiraceae bacterium]